MDIIAVFLTVKITKRYMGAYPSVRLTQKQFRLWNKTWKNVLCTTTRHLGVYKNWALHKHFIIFMHTELGNLSPILNCLLNIFSYFKSSVQINGWQIKLITQKERTKWIIQRFSVFSLLSIEQVLREPTYLKHNVPVVKTQLILSLF